MRLFLFNQTTAFTNKEISSRSKISASKLKSELSFLNKVRLVKKSRKIGNKTAWILNEKFPFLGEFQRLLLETNLLNRATILKKISKTGRVKVLILTGLFKEIWEGTLDVLIVSDNTRTKALESVIKTLEAELGREIRYCTLESQDFKYRLSVGDRLIRDVLDYPHEIVLDRMGLF